MKGFTGYHPAVQFIYYLLAVCFAMFSMHPAIILASLAGALLFFGALNGIKSMFSELFFCFWLFLLMAMMNPLFVHNGETILFFMNDNAITLEAMIYGGMASLMIVGVFLWCRCYSSILTTDKWLYLFGKTMPKIGLILSMAFRYIPLFQKQMKRINQSQKTMGLYATDSIPDRIGGGIRVFDSLIAWSMENSIDTADAMKARGYGLPGRSNFSLFRFCKRDGILLLIMGIMSVLILLCFAKGGFEFYYYPLVAEVKLEVWNICQYLLVFVFLCIPGVIEIKEKLVWNYLKSKI